MSSRYAALSAWPLVVVILVMMSVESCSNYILSATRAVVTAESLWSKGQHEATFYLSQYLAQPDTQTMSRFRQAISVPLSDMAFRNATEDKPFIYDVAYGTLARAGNEQEDIPYIIFLFRRFRGFPYLEEALVQWKSTDADIKALSRLADDLEDSGVQAKNDEARRILEAIDRRITPSTVRFSAVLNKGARFVETALAWLNVLLASSFAIFSAWKLGDYLRKRRIAEHALAWQATHDLVTGHFNRRAFEDALRHVAASSRGAVMFIDLDQFKLVNDTAGHAAGDILLQRVCPVIAAQLGANDMLARLGGDEFGILMPDADRDLALWTAEHIREAVENEIFACDGRRFPVTVSVGVVAVEEASSPLDIMAKADVACFMAKERGRNRVECEHEDDRHMASRMAEMSWVSRIHEALEEDRLCLFAQEIAPLSMQEGTYAEVLVRMRDETGQIVPPGSFLPPAERFGLMGLIDRRVVELTLAAMSRKGHDAIQVEKVAINISGTSVCDRSFLDYVRERIDKHNVAPARLCFEITESMAVHDLAVAKAFIGGVRAMGCSLSLDDFGAGMSSLRYLRDLMVDTLKIDGAFVRNLLTEPTDRAMVEMITKVGHVMGMKVVAEFVETEEIACALKELGVDYAQGYGIAKPRSFDQSFKSVEYERAYTGSVLEVA